MTAPSFEEAKNRRQKVRAAGLDPNYWYAVEYDKSLAREAVTSVRFWGTDVALFRDKWGKLHAMEDRCAHRQLKLSLGQVRGDRLVCGYHGWEFDKGGKLAAVPHELFGNKMPACKLKSYPVRVRYGLIWIFFGDPARAESTPMPEIPELEGEDTWACVPIDGTWKAHHSMILDNVSDFTHAYLHRKFKPFSDAKLTKLETVGDKIYLSYDTKVGGGAVTGLFIDRKSVDTNAMELCYDYPYQRSNTDDAIKHWCFVLPIDERTTRAFFLFYFKSFKIPFAPARMPRFLMDPIILLANRFHIKPLLREDGEAVEAEQEGYDKHYNQPIAELSPAVLAFQTLTIRKWEEYLAQSGKGGIGRVSSGPSGEETSSQVGSGVIDAARLTKKISPAGEDSRN